MIFTRFKVFQILLSDYVRLHVALVNIIPLAVLENKRSAIRLANILSHLYIYIYTFTGSLWMGAVFLNSSRF
jgi:hypothetical protein